MSIPTISRLADELFLRPIVISMNSLVLTSLMSYIMSETFDWRPTTICVTSDILGIGSDHLKDQESEFLSEHHNADGETCFLVYECTNLPHRQRCAPCTCTISMSHVPPPDIHLKLGVFVGLAKH
ncbi:hypothetical protein DFH29DRAFT_926678 [Suillus ampliporus]|nr:hypothetical protein DFH29DRAFT_926678 [Suillus ampliporus]